MSYDVIIIGAGASGLMCAIRAGERGLSVLVLDKADKPGKKILISGGGRCNFTNYNIDASAYLSPNAHFCKSALSRYTQWDIMALLSKHHLTYHEKTLGQLFCDQKSNAIIEMLVYEASQHNVTINCGQTINKIEHKDDLYYLNTNENQFIAPKLVIACGGPSFPKVSGSDFALSLAKQFKIKNTPFSPALVPLKLPEIFLKKSKMLAGVSTFVEISCGEVIFRENLLFTHRGLSGPAILQISSYWQKNETLIINLMPDQDLYGLLIENKIKYPNKQLGSILNQYLPRKLTEMFLERFPSDRPLQTFNDKDLSELSQHIHTWKITPSGSEGMNKAEVSKGGIHPDELSSRTFECKHKKNLYVIGEAIDVIGWLGGYNFQWAWASGWCCGDSL